MLQLYGKKILILCFGDRYGNSRKRIKSTIIRGASQIEIHSKEQLKPIKNKPLYLYFVRFEESIDGISIDSIYFLPSKYYISNINNIYTY